MTEEPQPRLILPSTSRASDAGHLAAADIAAVARALDVTYRLVGGNAVTLLTWVHGVNGLVPERETADADFGADPEVVGDPGFVRALIGLGYEQLGGNRFVRAADTSGGLDLIIDVLTPSFTASMNSNQPHGALFVDEIPGLSLAMARDPVRVAVETSLTVSHTLQYDVLLPDVLSALCMKALSYRARLKDRDALDIWRLLEAANASGMTAETWGATGTRRDAARILHRHFGRSDASGPRSATRDRGHQTRIRALVAQIVANPS